MSRKISPFLGVSYGWEYGENNWNTGMDENLKKFSFLLDGNIDGVVANLPVAVEGAAYYSTNDFKIHYVVGGTYQEIDVPVWSEYTVRTTGDVYQKAPDGSFSIVEPPINQTEGDTRYQRLSLVGTTGSALIASETPSQGRTALGVQTTAYLVNRANHTGVQDITTVTNLQSSLDALQISKVDKVNGKQLSTEDYTTAEKTKLAGLVSSHYRGTYTSLALLTSGVISPIAGDYARVDAGSGDDVVGYIWDSSDTKWVAQTLTAAQIKALYESNSNTNAYTTSEKAVVTALTPLSPLPTVTTNQYVYKPGSGWSVLVAAGGTPLLFQIQDQKPQGTNGGAAAPGFATRILNTVTANQIPGVTTATNTVTLPVGTYYIDARTTMSVGITFQARLYNVTDSSVSIIGSSTSNTTGAEVSSLSFVQGLLTITAPKTFRLESSGGSTASSLDLGSAANKPGSTEVYSNLSIWKLA